MFKDLKEKLKNRKPGRPPSRKAAKTHQLKGIGRGLGNYHDALAEYTRRFVEQYMDKPAKLILPTMFKKASDLLVLNFPAGVDLFFEEGLEKI